MSTLSWNIRGISNIFQPSLSSQETCKAISGIQQLKVHAPCQHQKALSNIWGQLTVFLPNRYIFFANSLQVQLRDTNWKEEIAFFAACFHGCTFTHSSAFKQGPNGNEETYLFYTCEDWWAPIMVSEMFNWQALQACRRKYQGKAVQWAVKHPSGRNRSP